MSKEIIFSTILGIIAGLGFLAFVHAQFSEGEGFLPPSDITIRQSFKGEYAYEQRLNFVTFSQKDIEYFKSFPEINSIIVDKTGTVVFYKGTWSLNHQQVYKQIKLWEYKKIEQEFPLLTINLSNCVINPKLPYCP